MSLRVQWDEQDLIIIKSIVDGESVAEIIIEESGDAVNKVIHVQSDHGDNAKVQLHACHVVHGKRVLRDMAEHQERSVA